MSDSTVVFEIFWGYSGEAVGITLKQLKEIMHGPDGVFSADSVRIECISNKERKLLRRIAMGKATIADEMDMEARRLAARPSRANAENENHVDSEGEGHISEMSHDVLKRRLLDLIEEIEDEQKGVVELDEDSENKGEKGDEERKQEEPCAADDKAKGDEDQLIHQSSPVRDPDGVRESVELVEDLNPCSSIIPMRDCDSGGTLSWIEKLKIFLWEGALVIFDNEFSEMHDTEMASVTRSRVDAVLLSQWLFLIDSSKKSDEDEEVDEQETTITLTALLKPPKTAYSQVLDIRQRCSPITIHMLRVLCPGVDVNYNGNTHGAESEIFLATKSGDITYVNAILKAKADVMTALNCACESSTATAYTRDGPFGGWHADCVNIVTTLVEAKADINIGDGMESLRRATSRTILGLYGTTVLGTNAIRSIVMVSGIVIRYWSCSSYIIDRGWKKFSPQTVIDIYHWVRRQLGFGYIENMVRMVPLAKKEYC